MERIDKPRVLIIDDELPVARMIKMVLEDAGKYVVDIETRPLEAMQEIERFRPDVIVLDIIMPDLNGIELGLKIREHTLFKLCPILFLTAAVSREDASAWETEVDGTNYRVESDILLDAPVITKPVTEDELIAHIDRAIADSHEF